MLYASDHSEAPIATISLLLLRLGAEIYGLPGTSVREVARYRPPLPVPGSPESLPGLISQRGAVIPVADLRPLLALPLSPPNRATRYVVAQYEDVLLALVADAVLDLVELPESELEALPAGLDPTRARLLRATARHHEHLVALLDLPATIIALRNG